MPHCMTWPFKLKINAVKVQSQLVTMKRIRGLLKKRRIESMILFQNMRLPDDLRLEQ